MCISVCTHMSTIALHAALAYMCRYRKDLIQSQLSRGCSLKKIPRTPPKKSKKKSQKSKDFFEDLKSIQLIWEWTTPRIQCKNPFLFIKSSYTKRIFLKIRKSEKSPQKINKPKEKIKLKKICDCYITVVTLCNVRVISRRHILLWDMMGWGNGVLVGPPKMSSNLSSDRPFARLSPTVLSHS